MDDLRPKFLLTEYDQAAKAYFAGVLAGQDFFRQYLYGNGVLGVFFGAAAGLLKDHATVAKAALVSIPIVAIISSLVLLRAMSLYDRHLDNCQNRCSEIEAEFGGKIFTRIGDIGKATSMGATTGLRLICCVFTLFWIGMFVVSLRI